MRLLRKCLLAAAALWVCSTPYVAEASPIAFSGTFTADNDVFQQEFEVLSPSIFTAQTTSYASGGFDPILTLYGPTLADLFTNLLTNDDRDFPNGDLDAFIEPLTLPQGRYTLVVTQSPNFGHTTLDGGFDYDGTPNFTFDLCVAVGNCDPPPNCVSFVDFFGNCRGDNFAGDFEITQVDTAVPEPGTIALVASGIAGLLIRRRRPRPRRALDDRPGDV